MSSPLEEAADWEYRHFAALVKKLGGSETARKLLTCKKVQVEFKPTNKQAIVAAVPPAEPPRRWREQDGVIYFTVTSDGTTGPQWVNRLEKKGFRLSDSAKSLLRSTDFQPTNGVTYEVAVLKGMLFDDNNRVTRKIRAEAAHRSMTIPNAEIACSIRETFSDEELEAMGLWWIIAMHEPIKDSVGYPGLLSVGRRDGGRWLDAYYGHPGYEWDRVYGFAFVVSQVGPQPPDA